jgi:signal transduction histidine kinase
VAPPSAPELTALATLRADGRLPVATLVAAIDAWQSEPAAATTDALRTASEAILAAGGRPDGWLRLAAPAWPSLELGLGSWRSGPRPDGAGSGGSWLPLAAAGGRVPLGSIWMPGSPEINRDAASLLAIALDLAWSRQEARASLVRLDALDAATAAIASELSIDGVLQLIVDQVRPLVSARYAAIGIVGERGGIERFVTSGLDDAARRAIGHLPRGHGILGLIIEEARSIRLDDLTAHPRSYGFPPNHPPMRSFLGVPVTAKGRSVGNLYLTDKEGGRSFTEDDERIVEMFARHAGIAIHNARLHEELGRLAIVEERERIGQDLHDGIIQALYAVSLSLEDLGELMADDPGEAEARVDRAIEGIHGAIRDIRNFIFGLRPELLEDVDLRGGLEHLADEFRRTTFIDITVTAPDQVDLGVDDAVQLLQLAREALSNVARHASASQVSLELSVADGTLSLSVVDDGAGFDPALARGPGHHGLGNMRDRAETLGGDLAIASRPGGGTRLTVTVPIDPADRPPEESIR